MKRSVRTVVTGTAALVAAWGTVSPAQADLYRCVKREGRVVYTDDPTLCPGSTPHEPRDVVQEVPTAPPSRPAPRAPVAGEGVERVQAARERAWRGKRREAEGQLAAAQDRQAYLDRFLTHCRRRGTLLRTDEAGLRHKVSCREVEREWDSLASKVASLHAYLAGGLEEECRRAGCLPGWVR